MIPTTTATEGYPVKKAKRGPAHRLPEKQRVSWLRSLESTYIWCNVCRRHVETWGNRLLATRALLTRLTFEPWQLHCNSNGGVHLAV